MTNIVLMPTRDVAARLGVHVRTVHRMVERGALAPTQQVPGYRGDYLFDPSAVDALAEERAR